MEGGRGERLDLARPHVLRTVGEYLGQLLGKLAEGELAVATLIPRAHDV
jgi:hypothetical protein